MDIRFKNTEAYVKSFAETKLIKYFLESYNTSRPRGSGIDAPVEASGRGGASLNVRTDNDGMDINLYGNAYLEAVDEGTSGGTFPNVENLKRWIREKPVTLKDFAGKALKDTDANVSRLAYVIGRSIERKGIAPANFIKEVVENAFSELVGDITQPLTKDVKVSLDEILTSVGYTKQGDAWVLKK